MPKITISRVSKGEKIHYWSMDVSQEQIMRMKQMIAAHKLESKKRLHEFIDKIPIINWEILRYSNNHNKDEVILKYPEHEDFINTIIW